MEFTGKEVAVLIISVPLCGLVIFGNAILNFSGMMENIGILNDSMLREEEERRKEKEKQPLAGEVDAAAKKGDLARAKRLQQLLGDLSMPASYFNFQTIYIYIRESFLCLLVSF